MGVEKSVTIKKEKLPANLHRDLKRVFGNLHVKKKKEISKAAKRRVIARGEETRRLRAGQERKTKKANL